MGAHQRSVCRWVPTRGQCVPMGAHQVSVCRWVPTRSVCADGCPPLGVSECRWVPTCGGRCQAGEGAHQRAGAELQQVAAQRHRQRQRHQQQAQQQLSVRPQRLDTDTDSASATGATGRQTRYARPFSLERLPAQVESTIEQVPLCTKPLFISLVPSTPLSPHCAALPGQQRSIHLTSPGAPLTSPARSARLAARRDPRLRLPHAQPRQPLTCLVSVTAAHLPSVGDSRSPAWCR